MRKLVIVQEIACLALLLTSSCYTLRKRMNSVEQHGFSYTHTTFASDSTFRYWYFASDSAFSYHSDSGLRTLSGRLFGWELGVNHKQEQQTFDSISSLQHKEMEAMQDRNSIWTRWYTVPIFLAVILVILFFMLKRK